MFGTRSPRLAQTWIEMEGHLCGARADERGPIGGGVGYSVPVPTTGDRIATLDSLIAALSCARFGETIHVESEFEIDCTERVYVDGLVLEVPTGVTLAGNRGRAGSRGSVICSHAFATQPLIRALGPGVRVTGLRLQGPNPRRCLDHHRRSFAQGRGHGYYYKFPTSDGIATEFADLRVDNCELAGWSHAAISLSAGAGHHIHHNFIHHNQYHGLGYGVSHGGASSLIEQNLFNYNRHSIAGSGLPGSGYEARHNVEIRESSSHCFDMHGGRDRKDGSDVAGSWLEVHHNTFRCPRPAVVIRGVPEEKAQIHHNWFHQIRQGASIRTEGRTRVFHNVYGSRAKNFVKGDGFSA